MFTWVLETQTLVLILALQALDLPSYLPGTLSKTIEVQPLKSLFAGSVEESITSLGI